MTKDGTILPPVPPQAGLETQRSQPCMIWATNEARRLLTGTRQIKEIVSGTVEILFQTHTDAPRGCSKYLSIPKGCELTGYGRLPISGQSLRKAFLSVLCASSEAGGEPNWFWGFDSADEDWRRNRL